MLIKNFITVTALAVLTALPLILKAQDSNSKLVAQPADYDYVTVRPEATKETAANVDTLGRIFKTIFTQDWQSMSTLYDAQYYTQHNPDMKDKVEGVIEFFKTLDYQKLVYQPVLQIAEGPYVVAYSKLQFAPGQPEFGVVDINLIQGDKSREHWDIIQPVKAQNEAGRSAFATAFADEVKVDQKTVEANKQLVADFINEVFNHKRADQIKVYIGDSYVQNGTGQDGREAVAKDLATQFADARVDIKRIIGQNDLVVAHSRVLAQSKAFARADIWRVRSGKLVEHWSVMQPVPDTMQHHNGMF